MPAAIETIALAGNPNAGKTTLFNALTGASQRTGNYAGVTVERKSGEFFTPHGRKLRVVDLPGCYALDGSSPDQEIARKALLGEIPDEARPDLVVCVVDASNLERHLVLALEVIELGLPVIIALNMVDVAEQAGLRLDPAKLSEELGVPVVALQANAGKGVLELKQALRHPFPAQPGAAWQSGPAAQLADRRRARVFQICEVAARRPDGHTSSASDKLDAWLLHPVWGVLVDLFLRRDPDGLDRVAPRPARRHDHHHHARRRPARTAGRRHRRRSRQRGDLPTPNPAAVFLHRTA
jgi:ferrous iron transport protein B